MFLKKKIFQKNDNSNNDIFIKPIDISDNTTANAEFNIAYKFYKIRFYQRG